jgi:hypothetical protein
MSAANFMAGKERLVGLLNESLKLDIADIENTDFPAEAFGKYNDDEFETYKLGYPNVEVRRSFSEFLS